MTETLEQIGTNESPDGPGLRRRAERPGAVGGRLPPGGGQSPLPGV